MKYKISLLLILFSVFVYSKNVCDCKKIIHFVSKQVEENSASYHHQVISQKKKSDYRKHKKHIENIAKTAFTNRQCLGVLQYYFSFLKDNHQGIFVTNDYYPFTTFSDTVSVKKFIKENVENISLKNNENKGMEGIWHHESGIFNIQIQKTNQKERPFVGVLTQDIRINNQFLGFKGDVKIDIYRNYKGNLQAIFWDFGQKPITYELAFSDQKLKIGNVTFYRNSVSKEKKKKFQLPSKTYFKELNKNTNYFRIHSFDYANKKNIDSIFSVNKEKLTKPNLIIDVRGNEGGSDWSYQLLLPYIMDKKEYEKPIIAASIFLSKENFKSFYNDKYKYGVDSRKDSLNADKKMEALRKYIGRFEPVKNTSKKTIISSIYDFPQNVYIIQNKQCASSTEGFILNAKQSKKVKTFGQNTMGALTYGDWREIQIIDFPARIGLTQKRMIFSNDINLEMIGITPDVLLNPDNEEQWVDIVLQKSISQ